ncbi:hypothetical protein LO763_28175 [Glycomyces sp. A-F 0318]|uniref:hypothetical protein n=1 Tax=Glycomyces amatae TaxID=2881355 RepID=UPI001E5502B2|nr:hypothetical protein [Glycomyces amatae]MCD0447499.1 hypothetical protein [Glycomyces amatae]
MDRWSDADERELGWLIDACGGEEPSGFGPPPYPAGLWILHAMYEVGPDENETLYRRPDDDEEGDDEPGWPADPGRGWRRLLWRELAERTGDPVIAQHVEPQYRVPSFRAFHSVRQGDGLWETVRWPDWGSLDRESFIRLAAILRQFSGPDTVAFAHLHFLEEPLAGLRVLQGRLESLEALELVSPYHSPANLWPADRSWLLYTDWDLAGTKVYGPPELLKMIEEDAFLETVRLPLTGDEPDGQR